jgi:hypothetical protein
MPRSIFLDKPKTAAFHCRISEELHGRIRAVQARLKEHDNGAVFPLDQIVEEALQRATRAAEAELSKRTATAPATPPASSR